MFEQGVMRHKKKGAAAAGFQFFFKPVQGCRADFSGAGIPGSFSLSPVETRIKGQ